MGELSVQVYGKDGCKLCDAAKQKLQLMGVEFTSHDLSRYIEHHEGWREDESVELLAAYSMMDGRIPLIRIGSRYHDYPGAIRCLKGLFDRNAATVEG